jgi:dTDP-4-dehydrorhamnose 3,5-epimerase
MINKTDIKILDTNFFKDQRGKFYEIYNKKRFYKLGIKDNFVQDSISISKKNVLRGLHYTIFKPQSQLLTVLEGKIFDCLVDLRKNSKTFKKVFTFILSHEKNNQIYMPKGIAHGFCVLSKKAILHYNTSATYDPKNEGGLIWSDKSLKIKWPTKKIIVSKRDNNFLNLDEIIKAKKLPLYK